MTTTEHQAEQPFVILVADDDPEILSLLAVRFRKAGYHVVEAVDGEETLTKVREHNPDLIILDVMMPGKSGWEVTREIRQNPHYAETGILMLTAIGEKINEMTSPLYGADDYLDKPFEFVELEKRVRTILSKKKPRSQRKLPN